MWPQHVVVDAPEPFGGSKGGDPLDGVFIALRREGEREGGREGGANE